MPPIRRTCHSLCECNLTIVGAGRDAWAVMRRGRGKTACARGASLALVHGRSASPLEGLFGRLLDVSSASFPVTRFEEPFVSAAVDVTASAPELHCPRKRSGINVPVAAADAGVAPLRRRGHSGPAPSFGAALRSRSELRACARRGSAKRTRWLCLAAVAVPLTIIGAGRESR